MSARDAKRPSKTRPDAEQVSSNGAGSGQQEDEDLHDLFFGVAGEALPHLPPGESVVGFDHREFGNFCSRWRMFLWFRVIEPIEHAGKRLYLCCPYPEDWEPPKKHKPGKSPKKHKPDKPPKFTPGTK